jgi:hypothetical protein
MYVSNSGTMFRLPVGSPAANRSEKQSYIKLQCKVNSWATLPSCILTLDWKTGGTASPLSTTFNSLFSRCSNWSARRVSPPELHSNIRLENGRDSVPAVHHLHFYFLFSRCSNWSARTPTLPNCRIGRRGE